MEMTSLRLLHPSMISIGSDMQQFLVTNRLYEFHVKEERDSLRYNYGLD